MADRTVGVKKSATLEEMVEKLKARMVTDYELILRNVLRGRRDSLAKFISKTTTDVGNLDGVEADLKEEEQVVLNLKKEAEQRKAELGNIQAKVSKAREKAEQSFADFNKDKQDKKAILEEEIQKADEKIRLLEDFQEHCGIIFRGLQKNEMTVVELRKMKPLARCLVYFSHFQFSGSEPRWTYKVHHTSPSLPGNLMEEISNRQNKESLTFKQFLFEIKAGWEQLLDSDENCPAKRSKR